MDDVITPTHMTLWGEEETVRNCISCNEDFPATETYFRPDSRSRKLRKMCRDCDIAYTMKYYTEKREYIDNIKKSSCCEVCGYDDYRALCFHHRDPDTKSFELSQGPNRTYEAIDAEIDKCAILCSNCHEIHHYEEGTGGGRPRTILR